MNKRVGAPCEEITYRIIGSAFAVHRRLGPGYREVIYQRALRDQFAADGLAFADEQLIEVFDGQVLLGYYIPDFIVEGQVVVEIKAFASLHEKYLGQVTTYLNYTGLTIGVLLNFGERSLHPHRIFRSPQAGAPKIDHRWLFVPDWLKAERQAATRPEELQGHGSKPDTD